MGIVVNIVSDPKDGNVAMCESRYRLKRKKEAEQIARDNVCRIFEDVENLNDELEAKKRKLDRWSKELNKCEALTEREGQNFDEEKKMLENSYSPFFLASFVMQDQRQIQWTVHKRRFGQPIMKF
ncbi:hypothetical protein GH714_025040 [Hevea brasiliensis]|uniref:Uncharacterized protein n=1 Tax=Hevea brasiliensis TaxID=3981 RepID=A0A6A6LKG4_HEVBR|nr:hypothetical protein GH714_025040 [Hevea brasiliensis]